jgi:hypothetical protein
MFERGLAPMDIGAIPADAFPILKAFPKIHAMMAFPLSGGSNRDSPLPIAIGISGQFTPQKKPVSIKR